MLTLQRFTGINNVQPAERLRPDAGKKLTALAEAMNVDIGQSLELLRRQGYSEASNVCHKNVWNGMAFQLATTAGGDLVSIIEGNETTLYPSLGVARVWYCNWEDGRTAFSNGSINGVVAADGLSCYQWGVPVPVSEGAGSAVAGGLYAGDYRWSITYQRLSDGLEGGPIYSSPITLGANSGLELDGLPQDDLYRIRVYLTSHNGGVARFAGSTLTDAFTFTGLNKDLVLECPTEHIQPAPVGTLSCQWRGSALVAVGPNVFGSKHARPEHFDLDDFVPFSGDVTLLQPVESGVFVGTTKELCFLAGDVWTKLALKRHIAEGCVLGSGVTVPGELLKRGDGVGAGPCMVAICGGILVAGFQDGGISKLTEGVYKTTATEVAAAFRIREDGGDRIPQYIALPQ